MAPKPRLKRKTALHEAYHPKAQNKSYTLVEDKTVLPVFSLSKSTLENVANSKIRFKLIEK